MPLDKDRRGAPVAASSLRHKRLIAFLFSRQCFARPSICEWRAVLSVRHSQRLSLFAVMATVMTTAAAALFVFAENTIAILIHPLKALVRRGLKFAAINDAIAIRVGVVFCAPFLTLGFVVGAHFIFRQAAIAIRISAGKHLCAPCVHFIWRNKTVVIGVQMLKASAGTVRRGNRGRGANYAGNAKGGDN
jgi:hypothetical protein